MSWITEFQNINYIAVAIATIASYVLGFIWYHWSVFGEAWATALGMTKEEADNTDGLGGAFAVSLISGFAKALFIACLMVIANVSGILDGFIFGATVGFAFTATSLGYYNGFARLSSTLTLINSAHSIVELALIGAIIGVFT